MILKKSRAILWLVGGMSAVAVLSAAPASADAATTVESDSNSLAVPGRPPDDGLSIMREAVPVGLGSGNWWKIPSDSGISIFFLGNTAISIGGPTNAFGPGARAQGGSTGSFGNGGAQGGSTGSFGNGVAQGGSTGSFGNNGTQGGSTGPFGLEGPAGDGAAGTFGPNDIVRDDTQVGSTDSVGSIEPVSDGATSASGPEDRAQGALTAVASGSQEAGSSTNLVVVGGRGMTANEAVYNFLTLLPVMHSLGI
ncbi:hypothetical protein [Pseudofrankia asymbiotica]|uniref:hypothetical protein n=1 Tax=Pseudofrankia asymbiotica TaxID=1834516 RepID=UPI0010550E2D|nr:hypothetical protein [Pseudofrankia asymbiotica]